MKYLFSASFIALSFCLSVAAEELPDYLEELAEDYADGMSVWGVSDDDDEDDNGNEFLLLKFESSQDPEVDLNYLVRVTVQVTDKKAKSVIFAQAERKPRKLPTEYADFTEWTFKLPLKNMEHPKLSAYAVEFGFMQDGYFVPVAVECDDVESAEEILNGEGTEVQNLKCTRSEHYGYN